MGSAITTDALLSETQGQLTGAAVAAPPQPPTFAPAEVQLLHKEDRHAGAYIVSIVLTIFTVALVAYATIALYAAYGK